MAGELTYSQIMSNLKKGNYSPVYYLMGDESFFIDQISGYMEEHVIPEEERDFNQIVVYGLDTTMQSVLERARAYPMMGEHQLILVKEAQHLYKDSPGSKEDKPGNSSAPASASFDLLSSYLNRPQEKTILVFCHKNGVLDKRRKVVSELSGKGVLFTSRKIRDDQIGQFIGDYCKAEGYGMDSKACSMLAEYVGADLSRLSKELDKLFVAVSDPKESITPDLIEKIIGISKEYNDFELRNAIIYKDIQKANRIVKYYEDNQKTYPIQKVMPLLFQYFSNLMLAWYAPSRTENGIAEQLGLKSTWGVKDYMEGMKRYSAYNVLNIISEIRYTLARANGVGISSADANNGLLREFVFKVLHQS